MSRHMIRCVIYDITNNGYITREGTCRGIAFAEKFPTMTQAIRKIKKLDSGHYTVKTIYINE